MQKSIAPEVCSLFNPSIDQLTQPFLEINAHGEAANEGTGLIVPSINIVLYCSCSAEVVYPAARHSRTVATQARARRRPARPGTYSGRNRAQLECRPAQRTPLEARCTLRWQGRPESDPGERKAAETLPGPAPAIRRTVAQRRASRRIPHR